jgi:hypothetical protein
MRIEYTCKDGSKTLAKWPSMALQHWLGRSRPTRPIEKEVNEEGTEAAAATAMGMAEAAAFLPPAPPKVFQADHPFLFFIRDRQTNAVLFSGRVLDPK